ncbi:hypothetical protein BS78_K291100 [Paspalum vaginatum]|uniref:Uncharacterized protein n=1 Tax=Paspalum vaginatum TaxID=158149 RepID=A0A9W7XCX5_9POAL|nr:hypothetical protein BS78_K291100 [Paspalum vaginatum]
MPLLPDRRRVPAPPGLPLRSPASFLLPVDAATFPSPRHSHRRRCTGRRPRLTTPCLLGLRRNCDLRPGLRSRPPPSGEKETPRRLLLREVFLREASLTSGFRSRTAWWRELLQVECPSAEACRSINKALQIEESSGSPRLLLFNTQLRRERPPRSPES